MNEFTMSESATGLHELFISLKDAGFDDHTALHILMGKPCCTDWCVHYLKGERE